MRKLTDADLANIAGTIVEGYHVEAVRVKRGPFTDSDHYGYILGRNDSAHYVCWQFHLDENEKPNVYWGNYFMEDREAAIRNFNIRDLDTVAWTGDESNEDRAVGDKDAGDVKMDDVQFSKHYDYFMGERRPFWRADYQGETIVTLCRTKAECLKEVREWISNQNKR